MVKWYYVAGAIAAIGASSYLVYKYVLPILPDIFPPPAPPTPPEPQPGQVISASIEVTGKSYGMRVDETILLTVKVRNTGNVRWNFGIGGTFRSPTGELLDQPLKTANLAPGEMTIVTFGTKANKAGIWEVRSSVWKQSSPPLAEPRLADTGWLEIDVG